MLYNDAPLEGTTTGIVEVVLCVPDIVTEILPDEESAMGELLPLAVELDALRVVVVACRSPSSRSPESVSNAGSSASTGSVDKALAEIWPFEMLTDDVLVNSWVPIVDGALDVEFGT